MKKIIVVLFLLSIVSIVKADETPKFNGKDLKKVEQQQFQNAVVYTDSTGSQYVNATFLITNGGYLIGNAGTPFEKWVLFPTNAVNLTEQDIQDIFLFIKSRDLKNRMK